MPSMCTESSTLGIKIKQIHIIRLDTTPKCKVLLIAYICGITTDEETAVRKLMKNTNTSKPQKDIATHSGTVSVSK